MGLRHAAFGHVSADETRQNSGTAAGEVKGVYITRHGLSGIDFMHFFFLGQTKILETIV